MGIDMPAYPQFVCVPNYPMDYAPGLQANYFFYDGLSYGVAPQAVPTGA